MIRKIFVIASVITLMGLLAPMPIAGVGPTVTVKNRLDLARANETITLSAADVLKAVPTDDVRRIHVRDAAAGRELLTQAVDVNDDGKFEELIFQVDIGPNQTTSLELIAGERTALKREDFKAYGRFVRERRDDFAWENDRVAHRMYGAALETWAQEPLTSSAVDVWTKRVPRLIINDWYMLDDYHKDNGTGGDFYSAGKSRGCGGNGLWIGGKLYPSANFRDSRAYANGPIRVMFELVYQPWEAAGTKVSEVKRITLDAGQNFSRIESRYTFEGGPRDVTYAAGIKNNAGSTTASSRERGTLRAWEPIKNVPGNLGCAVIVDPAQVVDFPQADGNYLVVAKVPAGAPAVYYAGFAWEQTGQVPGGVDGWDRYVAETARKLRSPLEVTIAK
jgi:pectinesterase